MSKWPPYASWDLNQTGMLPSDWTEQVKRAIEAHSQSTVLTGGSDLSREADPNYAIPVMVVLGDACQSSLPWLRSLYDNELRSFASKAYGAQLFAANDLRSSININCLRGVNARYEAHVDTNPCTGLLFACDASAETGGALVFRGPNEGVPDAVVWPRKGLFLAFDARQIPHYVSSLVIPMDRVSIPMNYYDDPIRQDRPDSLDDYLYTNRQS